MKIKRFVLTLNCFCWCLYTKMSASCIRSSRVNVLWFLMDFCQVSYRSGLLKVGKYGVGFFTETCRPTLLAWKRTSQVF